MSIADSYVRARIDSESKERAADALEAKYRDHDLSGIGLDIGNVTSSLTCY